MKPIAMLVGLLMLAGCLSENETGSSQGNNGTTPLADEIPPGCDAARRAQVHGPAGAAVDWDGPIGIPCLVVSQWGAYEPTIGITSQGSLFLYPAENALAEEAEATGQFTGIGIARSSDEGATFERRLDQVAGVVNFHPYTADPFMYVDPYTDRILMEDLVVPPFNCANLSYSDDLGETWTQAVAGCLTWDHVGYASGPSVLNDLNGYPAVIQRCGIGYGATTIASLGTTCQKSLDGGATWEQPGEAPFLFDQDGNPYVPGDCYGAVHHPFIDHRGWTWLARSWCDNNAYLALSKDEGATWTRTLIAEGPVAGHDIGVGVDPAGNVFAFWLGEEQRPLLAVSKDDGATWSVPIDIAPPGVLTAGGISIAAGGVGKAAFTYAATLDSDAGNVHAVVSNGYGLDGPAPIFQSVFVTTPEDPLSAGDCGGGICANQGDFLDGTIGPDGTAWGSFVKAPQGNKLSAGRLWGAPSLWHAGDANGPYPESTP